MNSSSQGRIIIRTQTTSGIFSGLAMTPAILGHFPLATTCLMPQHNLFLKVRLRFKSEPLWRVGIWYKWKVLLGLTELIAIFGSQLLYVALVGWKYQWHVTVSVLLQAILWGINKQHWSRSSTYVKLLWNFFCVSSYSRLFLLGKESYHIFSIGNTENRSFSTNSGSLSSTLCVFGQII